MDLIPLLGSKLKDDAIVELLELWDCEVIYDFDRMHENAPDKYWASVRSEGLQLMFDESQVLQCVFLHLTGEDGFTPTDLSKTDIPNFRSTADVLLYAETNGLRKSAGQGLLFDQLRDWVRLEYDSHSIHYEYRDGALGLVTAAKR